jgi:hypothetical protein
MAITTRQTSLLVQQDWTKVYQTFKDADFQSYDFESLRKTMIDYLRSYYPEDFNDFIESSEYIALIDLIAFLGQSLAFRADLNARENFIDTAERRDSILKLARLINYSPKRNVSSSGYLKIDSITTTETVTDSNGTDLANLIINWDDTSNDNWLEQFNAILNGAFVNTQIVGKPGNSQVLSGIQTDEYSLSIIPGVVPVYRFTGQVEDNDMSFEAVSATSLNQNYIYESAPTGYGKFNILYRNDNLGNSSNNTGFFVYFKQGELNSLDFTINETIPNRVVNVNFDNINNTDAWLYSLTSQGAINEEWTKVPAISGINIAYNKSKADRNLYQINSRANDQIDLVFGDGSFANVPQGSFRLYYRQSNGLTYKITPDELQNVVIPVNYISRSGRVETLTVRASLNYTIANAVSRESTEEIRAKAPQQYYTQNRMITGEDYNILPYTAFSTVLKTKAVNRTSSGVSRFLDVLDVTGKYSSTNIFGEDGYIYKDEYVGNFNFDFRTSSDIYSVLYNKVRPLLSAQSMQHFQYSKVSRYNVPGISWNQTAINTNASTGTLVNEFSEDQQFGNGVGSDLKYIVVGSMIRFSALAGQYFTSSGKIATGEVRYEGDRKYIYAFVTEVDQDLKTLTLNQQVPTGAMLDEIVPVFKNDLPASFISEMLSLIQLYKNFGIRYDILTQRWDIIKSQNLNEGNFSYDYTGDESGQGLDSSWLIKFIHQNGQYTVGYRALDYFFESLAETKFYFDDRVKVFDTKTGQTFRDQIKVLKVNSEPDSTNSIGQDLTWYIHKSIVEPDGFENNSKILITFPDVNYDGIPDNPDLFETIVNPTQSPNKKFVFFVASTNYNSFITYTPVDNNTINTDYELRENILLNIGSYVAGQIFYATRDDKFYQSTQVGTSRTVVELTNYSAKIGRQNIKFQYRHNSPNQRRIDPSPNNIMDLYILTKSYATDYTAWIQDTSNRLVEPIPPSSEELKSEFSSLENYKAISDTIIYNSAKFKPLFGSKAESNLRAKFKVVKNPNVIISDSDVKTSVIAAINNYFDINNWDFGETFYFSELSAYLHNTLTPNIASVIIVPGNTAISFGNMYQVNAQADEIIVSAATVDDVEIINSITAAQINQSLS